MSAATRTSSRPAAISASRASGARPGRTRAGDRGAEAGREQHDDDRADEHAAVELVDLPLDFALARARAARSGRLSRPRVARASPPPDTGTCRLDPRRRRRAAARARCRGTPRPACASAAVPSRTGRAGSWRRARTLEQVDVLIDDLPDPDHHVVGRRRCGDCGRGAVPRTPGAPQSRRSRLRSRRRRGTCAVMYAPNATAQTAPGRRRRHEEQKQLAIEARADSRRASARRWAPREGRVEQRRRTGARGRASR